MNRTDRLLAIVLELQRKRSQRAEDLAAIFETSKRTIYRDIQALCESGVPVIAQPGHGYSLVEGYFLPPVTFSADEATMLLLGSEFVADNFDAQYREAAETAGRKIEAVLSDPLQNDVEYLRKSIAFVIPETLSRETTANHLPQLRRAIIERKTVRFRYHTRYPQEGHSAENERDADPYGLMHYGDSWYLIAYCRLRSDFRNFKADRITELKVLDLVFERDPGFRLEPPEDDGRRLVVRALFDRQSAHWVRESRSYYMEEMEETPDGLLATLRVRMEDEVIQWLMSWGGHVKILEPESLQVRIVEEAKKILKNYSW
ncbi:MAG: YafY family transcriptional regulator [Acidobacteria bacterium]|nr:YafY family transcriptional regulator [Acidobacteriota bacterium]